jgi:rhamnogalacturonyl hydrolase YesR
MIRIRQSGFITSLLALVLGTACLNGQQPNPLFPSPGAGDSPDNPGPLARDLSPALKPAAVAKAMRKVGDWELSHSKEYFSQDWTFAALYRGYIAAAKALPEKRYTDEMTAVGNKFNWTLGERKTEGDDQAVGYMYLELYRQRHDTRMLEPTETQLEHLPPPPDICTETCPPWHTNSTPVWWWADGLFMAPPVWAEFASVTGKKEFLDRMDHDWWVTSDMLYDPNEHLYTRDESYLDKHETNGKKIFWSRGNGWVIAGIALVLDNMPADYPSRPRYIEQFRQMSAKLASLQGADGLWRPGLLNASAYPYPEVSGSAFYVYAIAWGINHGILDRATYLPVVQKGWAGLLSHVYEDGRLGSIQPIGPSPGPLQPQTSYVFGVGAYLMAGSEVLTLSRNKR